MKKRLYLKLLIGYVIFGILGFILVSTFSSHYTYEYIEDTEVDRLYKEANMIASTYASNYFNEDITVDDLHDSLTTLSTYLSSEIWVMNTDGDILINSNASVDMDHLTHIDGFNVADFGSKYYATGSFYNYYDDTHLTVFSPITINYKVRGYVLIHQPLSVITHHHAHLLNIMYLTLLLIFICATLLLIIIGFEVYIPIRKMIKGADAFAEGNFSYKIPVHKNDEIGYLAASLNYMANELNTLEDDQRKFISNVSHDFRSPLTSIKGYVEAMLDGTIPPEMQEKYLNIIVFETDRLSKLTQSLLELNKYGSHGTMLDISEFDINQLIKMTCLTFEGTCKAKRISFHLILAGKTLYVKADMSKIQQVVYNLIDNAIKFSHHDSEITIETTKKSEKVFVSVKDTGIGIPKDSQNKIFERFYKTDLSRGKDKKGSGLGLSIVKEIIQAHDENINVISTEGVGTEFIFTLPAAQREEL